MSSDLSSLASLLQRCAATQRATEVAIANAKNAATTAKAQADAALSDLAIGLLRELGKEAAGVVLRELADQLGERIE